MKRVVVTGATGLIGRALVDQCIDNNCEVFAVIRPNSARRINIPESEKVHIVECDLSNIADLPIIIKEPCDAFFHLAWSHTGKHKNDDLKYQIENIDFTIDAIRAARDLGCNIFIGAGSQAEYGLHYSEKTSPEASVNPLIPYGICKYAAGKLAALEGKRIGITCVWVRVFSIYGYNDKKESFMNSIIEKMHRNENIDMTDGIQLWDYLHCDDAAKAFFLIGKKCDKSAIYCLGSGQSRPLKDYAEIVSNKMNYKKPIGYGKIRYGSGSVMNLCADIKSLTEDTGWSPSLSFEEGLDLTIRKKALLEWERGAFDS